MHWEAAAEESRLLHHVLVYNLRQIKMTFEGQRGQEEVGELEVERSELVEESEERAEEQMGKWRGTCIKMNISKIIKMSWD